MRRVPSRLTPNQRKRQSLAWIEGFAGKPIAELRAATPPKPQPRKYGLSDDVEGPVLRAVGELLAVHPKVLIAIRQNSGALPYQNARGDVIPVWFFKIVTKQKLRISDYWGFLKDGRPFGVECKKPSWKEPKTDREFEQAAWLMMIRNLGGVGVFVRNVEEMEAALA